ncbi:hypothetical protein L249_8318 [Ophiocordyceps polyrhachis-furcata BCC 54312]|uniref:Uncharacterized protein n=1 Tax=Ophiocordyceps polyrhachis-furcata BCC 54312 TaxID=1330021 RepID=A0A367KZB7_9HYPO|nr:hypothetical protein L249_4498 [Ophiocordyceps polyrhachis-furcata BCC 54312]RCI07421.1 hypothetical protein L249_4499 [Ophiocordyceps polyrhachis-furcata BCC 54312]RCI07514.1 hypothetical protein L249_8317 [Ophiocordyceps polyrhachis-furcata BCC 54312]RCI07517.1 hypothetical protein L249_8318 [Ophiocordyceps polyrhachis-furcata BCC 54312]
MITLRWIILPPYNEGVHAAYSRSSFIIESDCTFEQRYLQLPTVFNQDVIDRFYFFFYKYGLARL